MSLLGRIDNKKPAKPETVSMPAVAGGSAYGRKALHGEVQNVQTAGSGTRNNTLNIAALKLGSLVASGDLNESEVIASLTQAAVASGLGLDEIAKTIASGMKKGAENPRDVPAKNGSQRTLYGGPGITDGQFAEVGEYSDDDAPDAPPAAFTAHGSSALVVGGNAPSAPTCWPTVDAEGIFAQLEPVKYLLAGLDICPGAPTLVAGYGFSGKTVSLQSAALSIAAGLPVWGSFAARQGRVLHVDHEQGAHLTRSKYQRLAASMLIGPSDIADRLVLVPMPSVYLDGPVEAFYAEKCAGFDLVIIDSLRAACPTLEENDSGARAVLDMLNRVSNKTGACFVVVHHARKPQQNSAGGARASIRGSGAIFDACGSVLVFDGADKAEPIRVSHEKARMSGRCADDFQLRIEDQDIDGYQRAGLTVTASGVSQAAPDRDGGKRLDALKERIKAYFREHGDQPSANSVRTRLGVNRDDLYAAMAELKKSGEVVNTGTDKSPNLHLHEAEKL